MVVERIGRNAKIGILLLSVAALLLGASAAAFAGDPAPRPGQARYETEFMTTMIDHQASALEMAELCVDKAAQEELGTLCEGMVAEQTHEIEMMQKWLEDWYDVTHESQTAEEITVMIEHLETLEGEEFEIFFMQHMIAHHRMSIREGARCDRRAYHDELQDMCEGMAGSQVGEVIQLHSWLCELYERCDFQHYFLSPPMNHA